MFVQLTYLCSLILFNNLFNFIWQWSCHQQIWRDYNNGYIKSPTNSLKNAKLPKWKRLKSKIFWSPFGKSDWLMNSKCLSNTVQHMWKWAIIPFFVCLNKNFLSVTLHDFLSSCWIFHHFWSKWLPWCHNLW